MGNSAKKKFLVFLLILSVALFTPSAARAYCGSNFFETTWSHFVQYFPVVVALVMAAVIIVGTYGAGTPAVTPMVSGASAGAGGAGAAGGASAAGSALQAGISATEAGVIAGTVQGAGSTAFTTTIMAGGTLETATLSAAGAVYDATILAGLGVPAAEAAATATIAGGASGSAMGTLAGAGGVTAGTATSQTVVSAETFFNTIALETIETGSGEVLVGAHATGGGLGGTAGVGGFTVDIFTSGKVITYFVASEATASSLSASAIAAGAAGGGVGIACASGLNCTGIKSSDGISTVMVLPQGDAACRYSLPVKFYIPQMGANEACTVTAPSYAPTITIPAGTMMWQYSSLDALFYPEAITASVSDNYRYRDSSCSIKDPKGGFGKIDTSSASNSYLNNLPIYTSHLRVGCYPLPVVSCTPVPNFSEANSEIAIYRFVLPTSASDNDIRQWLFQTIPGNVGGGYEDVSISRYYVRWSNPFADPDGCGGYNGVRGFVKESAPYFVSPASTLVCSGNECKKFCEGNVCAFNDPSVPNDSYVAYAAKVFGVNYVGGGPVTPQLVYDMWSSGEQYSSPACGDSCDALGPNKFLNIDNKSIAPTTLFYSKLNYADSALGNAIVGPYKIGTPDCPVPPAVPTPSLVNGDCGSADKVSFDTIPTANLCSLGTASAVSGSGPWSWTCAGTNGGSSASCSAGINTYPLSITPNGQGTVTGNPAGGSFPYGTIVTLTPSASGGNVFTGWSGDCSGAGVCAVTVDGAKNVTANFAALPGNFDLSLGGGGGSGAVSCNSVPLSWTASSDATAYRILRGSPRVDISPYQPYTALNHSDTTVSENTDYTYQIEAYNSAGTQRSNSINIATPYCPPTVNLSAFPLSVYQAQAVTLTWTTTYAAFCSASEAWSGSKPANGNEIVHPLTAPITSYAISCSGPGGTAVQSVSINVTPLALPDWREIVPR